MKPVPKMMYHVKNTWNPETFLISFKLETDESLLQNKSRAAIEKYGCDMVVANILATRRDTVTIFHKSGLKYDLKSPPEQKQLDFISSLIVNHIAEKLQIEDPVEE